MENSQDAAIGNFGENRPICTRDLSERIERLEGIIKAEFGERPVGPTLIAIIQATARASGFSCDELMARGRRGLPTLTKWRTVGMVVCRQKTDASWEAISRKFGRRERSTVAHLVQNADKYPDLRAITLLIENEL
jgi:chromosomal replication initiation ATPase DnaA